MTTNIDPKAQDELRDRCLASTHADSAEVIANRLADYFLAPGRPIMSW